MTSGAIQNGVPMTVFLFAMEEKKKTCQTERGLQKETCSRNGLQDECSTTIQPPEGDGWSLMMSETDPAPQYSITIHRSLFLK
ncbi:hypothetical protein EYF80_059786 [Liparis tanakae]|uniref:Uncharacterized protein n=1 Tax=Liparis tanakae TaxID=230148 RepID=A0A4Z2ENN1_9TELE|nr:hypothetical protein EYF80_059786 [Liparis tanakae]